MSVVVTFTGDASQLEAALSRLQSTFEQRLSGIERSLETGTRATQQFSERSARHLEGIETGFNRLMSLVGRVKSVLATLTLGVGLQQLATQALSAAGSFEQLDIQLRFVMGTVEAFQRARQFIVDFSLTSVSQLEDIAAAYVQLRQRGIDAERVIRAITDLTVGARQPREAFQGIIYAINEIASRGQLTGDVLNRQLGSWGVNTIRVREELQKMGFTLGREVADASISAGAAIEAILRVAEQDAKGFAAALQGTWGVLMSNLEEIWKVFEATIIRGPLFDFLKSLVLVFEQDLLNAMRTNQAQIESWGAAAIAAVTEALRYLATFLDYVNLVGQASLKLWNLWDDVDQRFRQAIGGIGAGIIGLVERMGQAMGLLQQGTGAGGYLKSLQEGKVTIDDVNKALQAQQELLQQGTVELGKSTPQAEAYFQAYQQGTKTLQTTQQSWTEWWASLIGADPQAATKALEAFLARARSTIEAENRRRDEILQANEQAAQERFRRAQALLQQGIGDDKGAAAKAVANAAKAQEQIIQQSLKRQEALISQSFDERRALADEFFADQIRKAPGEAREIAQARLQAMQQIALDEAQLLEQVRLDANDRLLAATVDQLNKEKVAHKANVAEIAKIEGDLQTAYEEHATRQEAIFAKTAQVRQQISKQATDEEIKDLIRAQDLLEKSREQGLEDFAKQTREIQEDLARQQQQIQESQLRSYENFVNRVGAILTDMFSGLLQGTLNAVEFFKGLLIQALSNIASTVLTTYIAPIIAAVASTITGGINQLLPSGLATIFSSGLGIPAGIPTGGTTNLLNMLGLGSLFGPGGALPLAFDQFLTYLDQGAAALGDVIANLFNLNTVTASGLTTLGGFFGLGGGIFAALTAGGMGGRIGGALGAAGGAAALASGLGFAALPAVLGPIGLALAAIAPLLGNLIDSLGAPAGPRAVIGGFGGLGVTTGAGGQLELTGALTSQIARAERLQGFDLGAVQTQLTQSATALIQGMLTAINEVALTPETLLGPTQDALREALAAVQPINSSNRKNLERDMQEQVRFVGVQLASFFLDPLNLAAEQLQAAPLQQQLERFAPTITGMATVFKGMNDQIDTLSRSANTDVLRQLSAVRNRVENFGNQLVEVAGQLADAIVAGLATTGESALQTLLSQSAMVQHLRLSTFFTPRLQAAATLQAGASALGAAGLDYRAIQEAIAKIFTTIIEDAFTLVRTAFSRQSFAEALGLLASLPDAVAALNPVLAQLKVEAQAFLQVVGPLATRIDVLRNELRTPAERIDATAASMADLNAAIAQAGTSIDVALPLYAKLAEAIEANAQAQIEAVNEQAQAQTDAVNAAAEAQQQAIRVQREAVDAAVEDVNEWARAATQAVNEWATAATKTAQQLSSVQSSLLAEMSPAAQQATLEARKAELEAVINATGSQDAISELVTVDQQLLALAKQSDNLTLQADMIAELQALESYLEQSLAAQTGYTDPVLAQISLAQQQAASLAAIEASQQAQLASGQAQYDALAAQEQAIAAAQEAQLNAIATWQQETVKAIKQDLINQLVELNRRLYLLWESQEAVKTALQPPIKMTPTNAAGQPYESLPISAGGAQFGQRGGLIGLASGAYYAQGGLVRAWLEPGESIWSGHTATQDRALAAMNEAFPRFGGGGIVPGSGSGDQVPMWLPPGTRVVNREATRAMGFQGGGVIAASAAPTQVHNYYYSFPNLTIRSRYDLEELKRALREVERRRLLPGS